MMSDQCKHCVVKGDLKACEETECYQHENWYALQLKTEIDRLKVESETLENECKRLWSLLDDISTAGDMYKPEINGYFKYVNKASENRNGLFESDGHVIDYACNLRKQSKNNQKPT